MSAQGVTLCHRDSNDAGCDGKLHDSSDLESYVFKVNAFSDGIGAAADKLQMVVDSGCNMTFLPEGSAFRKFVVSEEDRPVRMRMGSKDSEVVASGKCVLHLPLRAEDGTVQIAKEVCVFSKKCRCPLYAAMYRDTLLSKRHSSSVEVDGLQGNFQAVVDRLTDKTPVLTVLKSACPRRDRKLSACAATTASAAIGDDKKMQQPEDREGRPQLQVPCKKEEGDLVKGIAALQADPTVAKSWSSGFRRSVLLMLHRRLAHATCKKLYLTLVEHGLGGAFTEAECRGIDCDVCCLVNARKVKIPRVADALRQEFAVKEIAYQDLMMLPKAWDGSRWVSVIVDARSRQIDLFSIKAKDAAISHAVGYIRRAESEGFKVKRWRSDNGGEFFNDEFESMLRKEGILPEFGAPYTPETQGVVERVNGTVKRLLGKLLRATKLPVSVWPALLPGVAQQINSVVHSTLKESPLKQSGSSKAGRLPLKAIGDVVLVVDPKSKEALEGIYGGSFSLQDASVIVRTAAGKWRVRRVHPSAVQFRAFQGERDPMVGGNPLVARGEMASDQPPCDAADYDLVDGDAYDENGVSSEAVDDGVDIEAYGDGDTGVYVDVSLDINDGEGFAGVCNNKARNQIPATQQEVLGGSHRDADMKELRSYFNNQALGPLILNPSPDILANTLTAGWRRTWKIKDETDTSEREGKSRLFVHGFKDPRDRGCVETHAGTADPGLERINHIYALYRGWRAAKVDISTAFLQEGKDDDLYIKLPRDLPPEAAAELGYVPGGVYKQKKALYGRNDAPNIFTSGLRSKLEKDSWKNVAEAIYVLPGDEKKSNVKDPPRGIMRTHMDDLFCNGDDPVAKLESIKKYYKTGPITEFTSKEWGVYTGIEILWDKEKGVAQHSQKQYVDNIDTKLTGAEKRRRFGAKDLELTREDEINVEYQKEHQSWTGTLGWLARTQRFLSVVFSMVSRNSTRPSAESVLKAKRACEYAKEFHSPLVFHGVVDPVLLLWVDGNYDLATCDGRKGWEGQLLDESEVDENDFERISDENVIGWRSQRHDRKLGSSSSSELVAFVSVVKQMPLYTSHIEKLWGCKPKVFLLTDSQPLIGWLNTKWIKSDPKLQGMLDLVLERLAEYGPDVKVRYVRTEINKADKHTKFIHALKL